MKPHSRTLGLLFTVAILFANQSPAQSPPAKDAGQGRLIFQTNQPWSPRTNINADTVMVYGIDDTVAQRIDSWRSHGYHVTVMTGVAWGRYAPYLRGDFDGKPHWNETQQEKSGKLILHSGREVPYIAPSISYGLYLSQGVKAALEAGAEAGKEREHLGRRVGLHGVEHARVGQCLGEAEVVLADDIEIDDEARPVVMAVLLAIAQEVTDARGHGRSPHQVQ